MLTTDTRTQVIHNAKSCQVTLADNRKFSATLKGAEPDKDLAVLKIDVPSKVLECTVRLHVRMIIMRGMMRKM